MMPDIFGRRCGDSFAYYDHNSSSLRMCQGTLFSDLIPSSVTLPKTGTMRNGVLFPLRAHAERHIPESGSLSWPSPGANDWKGSSVVGQRQGQLDEAVERKWATPQRPSGHRQRLNPRWVEALMGFPVGWGSLSGPPLRGKSNTDGSPTGLAATAQGEPPS